MVAPVLVEGVGKRYVRRRTPVRTWRELLTPQGLFADQERFWALRDVSFAVPRGSMVGVIGGNGAGKSTLLRLLGGIGRPDEGRLTLLGKVRGLFDLGGGFLGDLTGRENAMLAAVVAGFTRPEARARMRDVIEFAELASVIDAPLRTYSTGMVMRLAFAVAVHTEPDVLLVDEFLAVGDLSFQAKCVARIQALKEGGAAVVLVSHGMDQIRQLCDEALWLRDGRVVAQGSAEVVAGAYEAEMRAETLRRTPERAPQELVGGGTLRINENRFGSLEVEIDQVEVEPTVVRVGGELWVTIHWRSTVPVSGANIVLTVRRDDGTICVDTNTQVAGVVVPPLVGRGIFRVSLSQLTLGAGTYFADVGIFARDWSHALDYHWHAYPFAVEGASALKGVVVPQSRWTVGR